MNIKNKTNYIVRTDIINDYLKDINAYKVLTAEEERALFSQYEDASRALANAEDAVNAAHEKYIDAYKRFNEADVKYVETGDSKYKELMDSISYEMDEYASESTEARETLKAVKPELEATMSSIREEILARNQRFVLAVAKRYSTGDLLPDIISEGNIGLAIAFDSYELSTGNRFCSYAVWYIRRQINHFITSENVTVRSTNNSRVVPKVKRIKEQFYQENGRYPSDNEIIELLGKEGVTITNESDIYGVKMEYIDAAMGDDDDDNVYENCSEFTSRTASSNEYMDRVEDEALSENMRIALGTLTDREQIIVKMSAGVGYSKEYTNKEIAEKLGLTAERVRQLRIAALTKMKTSLSKSNR